MNGRGIILYSNDCIFSGEIDSGLMNDFGYFSKVNGNKIKYYLWNKGKISVNLKLDFEKFDFGEALKNCALEENFKNLILNVYESKKIIYE